MYSSKLLVSGSLGTSDLAASAPSAGAASPSLAGAGFSSPSLVGSS